MGQVNVWKVICRLVLLAGAPPVALNELLHMARVARVLDTLSDVRLYAKTRSVKFHCKPVRISADMMFRLVMVVMVRRMVFSPSGNPQR